MYTRCLSCRRHLGANSVVPQFPVGVRLAFDAIKGRLWVVCATCGRWNLTALEERWEAIEQCERLFSAAHRQISTQSIGSCRVHDLELIRIGRPSRAEFAAWRYGARVRKRLRRSILLLCGGLGSVTIVSGAGLVTGLWSPLAPIGLVVGGVALATKLHAKRAREAQFTSLPLPQGGRGVVRVFHVANIELWTDHTTQGWKLSVPYDQGEVFVANETAAFFLDLLLPVWNATAGSTSLIERALAHLDRAGGPEQYLVDAVRRAQSRREDALGRRSYRAHAPLRLDDAERVALEMAANEETERRAARGELDLLENAWREAEEIAHIADNLFLPTGVEERIEEYRNRLAADDQPKMHKREF